MNQLATNIYSINGEVDLLSLADELARNMRPTQEIWMAHGLGSKELAAKVLAMPAFQTMYFEARARWESTDALPDRVRTKSGVAVEQLIPEMYAAAADAKNALNHRVDAFKALSRLGRLEPEAAEGGGPNGGGVQISINFGGDPGEGQADVTVIESVGHSEVAASDGALPEADDVAHAGDHSATGQDGEDFSIDGVEDLDLGDLGPDEDS